MSLSIAGIGAVQPVYAPSGPAAPYAQNQTVAESVAGTTAGAELGATSVVYEPSASDADEQLTYSNRELANRSAALAAAGQANAPAFAGDEAVVAATGGTVLPPPQLPDTPRSAEVKELLHNVWAPVRAVMADPVAGGPAVDAAAAHAQAHQAETSAQASYAAVVDAAIVGAPLADLEKFA